MTAATVKLVGQKAGGREHIVATAGYGDPVLLLPEPDNPHDPNAIAVYTAPRHTIIHPDQLRSSLTDPDAVGHLSDDDRRMLLDRQAGYVGRNVAARLALPPDGIVGFVSEIRYAPEDTHDAYVATLTPLLVGFDIAADLTPWQRR